MTNTRALKKTLTCLAAALAAASCASVMAQTAPSMGPMTVTSATNPYVVDGNRVLVRNNFGNCWRTGFWTLALATATKVDNSSKPVACFCDPDLIPAAACADPAPAVTRAAPVMVTPVPVAPPVPLASKITIDADTLFAFDTDTLSATGKAELDTLLTKTNALNLEAIVAVGYADRIGSTTYNVSLSERRAQTIKAYLVNTGGIEASRIFIEGRGESMPVTGDACINMGPEKASNKPLVACLKPDRRVDVEAVGVAK